MLIYEIQTRMLNIFSLFVLVRFDALGNLHLLLGNLILFGGRFAGIPITTGGQPYKGFISISNLC